jgi:hypothetical protein
MAEHREDKNSLKVTLDVRRRNSIIPPEVECRVNENGVEETIVSFRQKSQVNCV